MKVRQVWQAEDGSTHETEEAAKRHNNSRSKYTAIQTMYHASPHSTIDFIVNEWEAIKAVMEG